MLKTILDLTSILSLLAPVVIFSAALALLLAIVDVLLWVRPFTLLGIVQRAKTFALPAIPISVFGFVVGFLSGLSRSETIGTILPATIALIGGGTTYLFGSTAVGRNIVGFCAIIFVINVLLGGEYGAAKREAGRLPHLIALSDLETQIRTYRTNRGLNPDLPSWIADADSPKK